MDQASVYQDIALRTGGSIYIGVVGPVRTGKICGNAPETSSRKADPVVPS